MLHYGIQIRYKTLANQQTTVWPDMNMSKSLWTAWNLTFLCAFDDMRDRYAKERKVEQKNGGFFTWNTKLLHWFTAAPTKSF